MNIFKLDSIAHSIYCSEGVTGLIPYEDKLKFMSRSMYCSERVADLIPYEHI